jgi:hypothetical protein
MAEFVGTLGGLTETALVASAPRFYIMIFALMVSVLQMEIVLSTTDVQF